MLALVITFSFLALLVMADVDLALAAPTEKFPYGSERFLAINNVFDSKRLKKVMRKNDFGQ